MASTPTPAILVSHSHWDRAWYLPFETFRFRLVRMVDRLLDLLEADTDFRAFTLDGQTVLLEDYVEIRPEEAPRLRRLIAAGRLVVGPFYVLPDLFLVSGESLIRNLQRGLAMSEAWSSTVPPVGYVPDPFGHPAQMPQLLAGFGLGTYLLTRGLDEAAKDAHGSLFRWQAPDGSAVTAFYARDGYFNAAALGHADDYGRFDGQAPDVATALSQIDASRERLLPLQPTRTLLLLNGFDHMPEQPTLPRLLGEVGRARPDWAIVHGTLTDFFAAIAQEAPDLPTATGELIGNADHPILLSVYSTRLYLKRQNHAAQHLLTQLAEPLRAWAHLEGRGPDARPFLDYAWRELLRNHPHDDICGCSLDAVHRDDEARFRHVDETGRALVTEALELLLADGFSPRDAPEGTDVFVFNPHPFGVRQRVTCEVLLPNREGEFGPTREAHALRGVDGRGRPVGVDVRATEAPMLRSAFLEATWGRRYEVAFEADVPPLGYTVVRLFEDDAAEPAPPAPTPTLENDRWHLDATGGGLVLTDRATGEQRHDVLRFAWERDAGDTYSFGPVAGDAPRWARLASVARDPNDARGLRCHFTLDVPRTLDTDETVRLDLEVRLTLDGARGLHVSVSYENRACDGRLRAFLPTETTTAASHADALFWLAPRTRPALLTPEDAAERYAAFPGELTYTTQHMQDFVLVGEHPRTWVAARGLPEYELVDAAGHTWVAVTLCRSVGWLSVKGGRIRRVAAGPKVPTPEAQCLREMGGDLLYGFGDETAAVAAQAGRVFSHPLWAQELPHLPTLAGRAPRPRAASLLALDNPAVVLSALRPEPHGPGVVLRLVNPTDAAQTATVTFGLNLRRVCPTDLRDTWDEAAAVTLDGPLIVALPAGRVATFVLRST